MKRVRNKDKEEKSSKRLRLIDDEAEAEGKEEVVEDIDADANEDDLMFIDDEEEIKEEMGLHARLDQKREAEACYVIDEEEAPPSLDGGGSPLPGGAAAGGSAGGAAAADGTFPFPDYSNPREQDPKFVDLDKYKCHLMEIPITMAKLERELKTLMIWLEAGDLKDMGMMIQVMNKVFPARLGESMHKIKEIAQHLTSRILLLQITANKIKHTVSDAEFASYKNRVLRAIGIVEQLSKAREAFAQAGLILNPAFSQALIHSLAPPLEPEDADTLSLTNFQKALLLVEKYFRENRFRHKEDRLYLPDVDEYGQFRCFFKAHPRDIHEEIRYLASLKTSYCEFWQALTKTAGTIKEVAEHFVQDRTNPYFPILKPDAEYFRYLDGVFDARNGRILEFKDIKEDIVCTQGFDVTVPTRDLAILDSPFFLFDLDPREHKIGDPRRKMFQTRTELAAKNDWFYAFEDHCPAFISILRYQIQEMPPLGQVEEEWHYWDAEILLRFFLALFGRALFPLASRDNWQKVLMVLGVGGTGKSELADFFKRFYGLERCAIFAAEMEKTFGISGLYGKDFWMITEMRTGFQFPPTDFLSLVVNECLLLRIKFKTPFGYQSRASGFVIGNEWPRDPKWQDKRGSMCRRSAMAQFNRPVTSEVNDTEMRQKLVAETPAIAFFAALGFRALLNFMARKRLNDPRSLWHYSFTQNEESVRAAKGNLLLDFLQSPYVHRHNEDSCEKSVKMDVGSTGSKKISPGQICHVTLGVMQKAVQTYATIMKRSFVWDLVYFKECIQTFKAYVSPRIKMRLAKTNQTVRDHLVVGLSLTDAWKLKDDNNIQLVEDEQQPIQVSTRRAEPPIPPYLEPGFHEKEQKELKDVYDQVLEDCHSNLEDFKFKPDIPKAWLTDYENKADFFMNQLRELLLAKEKKKADVDRDTIYHCFENTFKAIVCEQTRLNSQDNQAVRKYLERVQFFRTAETKMGKMEKQKK